MPLAVAADVKQALADSMQMASTTELGVRFDRIIADALKQAERDVVGAFAQQGYTRDQITSSDDIYPLHLSQSLYWTYVRAVGMHSFDKQMIDALDQRRALTGDNAPGLDDTAGLTQGDADPGFIQCGRAATTGDDWTRSTKL